MFTQQHYIEIAKTLRKAKPRGIKTVERDRLIWAAICRELMNTFEKDNPRFDRQKFINFIILGREVREPEENDE